MNLTVKQEGEIWSRIRSAIEGMPAIEKAMQATRYEEASAHWDDAARQLTARVVDVIQSSSETNPTRGTVMGCQPGPNYGKPTIITRDACPSCDGKGFRWAVPANFNPFEAGGWNTIREMFKTTCPDCRGLGISLVTATGASKEPG